MLPMCTLCYGDRIRPAASPSEAEWAQRFRQVVDRMMLSILQLRNQMIDHETILQENPRNLGRKVPRETLSPQERPSGSADSRPAEGRVSAWTEDF